MFIYEKDGRKRSALEVICNHCGKKFLKAKRLIKENNYCCIEHAHASQRSTIKVLCALCGKGKEIKKSSYEASKTKTFFCNRDCQSKSQSIGSGINYSCNYVDGAQSYRRLAFRTYPNKCEVCGYDEHVGILDVHHIDSDRSNNSVDNLIILCPNHHVLITRGLAKLRDRKIELIHK